MVTFFCSLMYSWSHSLFTCQERVTNHKLNCVVNHVPAPQFFLVTLVEALLHLLLSILSTDLLCSFANLFLSVRLKDIYLKSALSFHEQVLHLKLNMHQQIGTLIILPFQGQMFQHHPQIPLWGAKLLFSQNEHQSQTRR